ncbi:protein lin-52 homolog [Panonychus citri]|uniref:protein lin-52 homolog n=1 Tax=Panonychus citri TaxID=50023 RepID=UPI0023072B2B|nr:protein lin-52 homolog [Panonychus citri]
MFLNEKSPVEGRKQAQRNSTRTKNNNKPNESPEMNNFEIPCLFENELEKYLFSEERLDASSPDLWPEQIPGMTDFLARSSPINSELFHSDTLVGEKQETPEWLRELDQDDINMLHGFGSLTTFALLDRVKELQDLSFQLGLEESREMTRGRFLGVLSSENNPPSTSSGSLFNRD